MIRPKSLFSAPPAPLNWKDSRCSFWALGTIMLKNRSAYTQSKAHGTGLAFDTCQGKKWQICQERPFYLGPIRDRSVLVYLRHMDEGRWQAYRSKTGEEDMKRQLVAWKTWRHVNESLQNTLDNSLLVQRARNTIKSSLASWAEGIEMLTLGYLCPDNWPRPNTCISPHMAPNITTKGSQRPIVRWTHPQQLALRACDGNSQISWINHGLKQHGVMHPNPSPLSVCLY